MREIFSFLGYVTIMSLSLPFLLAAELFMQCLKRAWYSLTEMASDGKGFAAIVISVVGYAAATGIYLSYHKELLWKIASYLPGW